MKLALLATLVTFAGSLGGFAAVTAGSPAPAAEVAAKPAAAESVIVQRDPDCPRPGRADEA